MTGRGLVKNSLGISISSIRIKKLPPVLRQDNERSFLKLATKMHGYDLQYYFPSSSLSSSFVGSGSI
jgi:hypothetical protein